MGTDSEGSDDGGWIVDQCEVGAIVWVRRRNGSWWPGRILDPKEASDSHLMLPRAGNPVKLLGREDACVDWYNLEKSKKSKHVKPFRCEEFDALIKKAEASRSVPIKKREKYSCREEAILHALELEKQNSEMKQENTGISFHEGSTTSRLLEKEINYNSPKVNVPIKLADRKSQTSSRKVCSPRDKSNMNILVPAHRKKKVKPSISEDEKHENATVMCVDVNSEIKSKGKLFLSIVGANSDVVDESLANFFPQGQHNLRFSGQAIIDKNSVPKRTLLTGSVDDYSARRKDRRDRRRPLLKVLQNSTKLPDSYSCQPHNENSANSRAAEEHFVGVTHDAQKSAVHPSPDDDYTVDYSSKSWKHTLKDSGNACKLQQSNESTPSGWTEENDFDSSATDSELENVEEKLRSGITQPPKLNAESSIESGMSQWHLKGKRNNRIAPKRPHGNAGITNFGVTDKPSDAQAILNASGLDVSSEKENDNNSEDNEILIESGNGSDDFEKQHSDSACSDEDHMVLERGWGTTRPPFQIWKAYWDEEVGEPEAFLGRFYASPFGCSMIPTLFDVDLKVHARYRGERVPLVSLTSGLNGMAIVGHPVCVEVLEDGSIDHLLFTVETKLDGDASTPPPIWRTSKRTLMHRPPRLNSNPPNRSQPLASQTKKKTRPLSSFVSEKKQKQRLDGRSIFTGGSMPLVTCIPTKVVFSRILESVGRSPAWRTTAADADRGPS